MLSQVELPRETKGIALHDTQPVICVSGRSRFKIFKLVFIGYDQPGTFYKLLTPCNTTLPLFFFFFFFEESDIGMIEFWMILRCYHVSLLTL